MKFCCIYPVIKYYWLLQGYKFYCSPRICWCL